uniref:Uncharacterized protein n=1 Tax=viral metagenome TaxID=1070528 RepID=A0A6C0JV44_9ZZZZ
MGRNLEDYEVKEKKTTKVIDETDYNQDRPGVKVIKIYQGRHDDELLRQFSDNLKGMNLDLYGIAAALPGIVYYVSRDLWLTSSLFICNLIMVSKLKDIRHFGVMILLNVIVLAIVFALKGLIKAKVVAVVFAIIGIITSCLHRYSAPYILPLILALRSS